MAISPDFLELLECVKLRHGLSSDLQLDDLIGVRGKVCRWRKGSFLPSYKVQLRLADLAGRGRGEVLAMFGALDAEKQNDEEAAREWRAILRHLSQAALLMPRQIGAVLLLAIIGLTSPHSIGTSHASPTIGAGSELYIMRLWRRWRRCAGHHAYG